MSTFKYHFILWTTTMKCLALAYMFLLLCNNRELTIGQTFYSGKENPENIFVLFYLDSCIVLQHVQ